MPHRGLAPQMIHNTSAPTRSGVDVRRMGSKRPLALLQTTTARETLLGADAHPYVKVQGKEAKALFQSKYVPMDDGTDVLVGCNKSTMSQRGYGNRPVCYPVDVPKTDRIGFDNTLVDTTSGGFKISKAGIIHHPQNAVYTDFHKGVLAGYDPASQPMWADGTYNETVAQMTKEHSGLPEEISFLPPHNPRQDVFNIQSLAGGEVYGDALLRKEITEKFAEQRGEDIKNILRKAGVGEDRIEASAKLVNEARVRQDIAKKIGLSADLPEVKTIADLVMLAPGTRVNVIKEGGAGVGAREPMIRELTPEEAVVRKMGVPMEAIHTIQYKPGGKFSTTDVYGGASVIGSRPHMKKIEDAVPVPKPPIKGYEVGYHKPTGVPSILDRAGRIQLLKPQQPSMIEALLKAYDAQRVDPRIREVVRAPALPFGGGGKLVAPSYLGRLEDVPRPSDIKRPVGKPNSGGVSFKRQVPKRPVTDLYELD